MESALSTAKSTQSFYRLTALWAFSEAFLGGMLHGFHLPVTGLVLGSFAVFCLTAIHISGSGKGRLLRATFLVMLVKAILSPHSPPQAYLAVFLQGALAEFIFSFRISFRLQCYLLAVLALVESAFQRLIVLVFLFGKDLFEAFDGFVQAVLKTFGFSAISYSNYLVSGYVGLHVLMGLVAGFLASQLPKWIADPVQGFGVQTKSGIGLDFGSAVKKKSKSFSSPVFWIIFMLILLALYDIYAGHSLVFAFKNKPLKLLIRSALVFSGWYFFLAPLLMRFFSRWMEKQQSRYAAEVAVVLHLMPEMKSIFSHSWAQSKMKTGLSRWVLFLKLVFYFSMSDSSTV